MKNKLGISHLIRMKSIVRNEVKKYINENKHLLITDDAYNVNCGLKPRLVVRAVEQACKECRRQEDISGSKNINNCYLSIFTYGSKYATDYLNRIK